MLQSKMRFVGGLFACVLFLGCASNDKIGPVFPESNVPVGAAVESALIGPDGGSLAITGAVLTIPAGALSRTVDISIERLPDNSVELGPNGLTFLTPVSLTLSAPGGDASGSVIRWFNPSAGIWVVIPSSVGVGTRTASLAHFSNYEIIDTDEVM
jgi:hypothetical protein